MPATNLVSRNKPVAGAQTNLLRVEGLRTYFYTRHGVAKSVDGVDFHINKGEHVGLIGESGSGKSVTALSIMRLVRQPPGKTVADRMEFEGQDLLGLDMERMRQLRGSRMCMVFQDPVNHLDPVMKVGGWISETLRLHKGMSCKAAKAEAIRVLKLLKVAAADDVLRAYPFQLSGGMCQRVSIATAIVTEPALVIADEATSALDATVQASILKSLRHLTESIGTAVLLTTHNVRVVRSSCSRVLVMYAGRIVESSATATLFDNPMHPYTVSLLNSILVPERAGQALISLRGEAPLPTDDVPGCSFYLRCSFRRSRCQEQRPPLTEVEPGHWSACFFPGEAQSRISS